MATDILTILREYCIGNRKMRYINYNNETYVAFDDFAFPKNADTPLAVYGKQGEYYNLESLIYLWNHKDLVHTTYVKDTALKGIVVVTRSDRRAILDYLKGATNEFPSAYDPSFPPKAPIPTSRLRDETTAEPERKKQKLEPQAEKSQRLDSILSGEQSDVKQIRSLNENLDADKINLLRKKKLLNQKNKIADVGDNVDLLAVAAAAPEKEARMEKERVWRTRANCMDSMIKDFSNVFELLQTLQKKEAGAGAVEKPAPAPAPKIPTRTAKAVPGYSRYDQEIFTKDTGADFNIDTEVSFVGQSINNLKAKPTPIPTSAPPRPVPASHHPHPAAKTNEPPAPRRRTNRTPIIVIPGGMAGTLINMYNVRDILQDMTFKTPEEKKGAGMKRETECQLHRKRGEVTVPYRVIENPLRLTDEEWDRVVAIFVMGPTWQFKGWKWQGNPVEIFSHIPAFHLHYDDLKIDKNVAQWSVTFIPISRSKRHLDKARLAKFWDTLDRHIIKHKSHLRY